MGILCILSLLSGSRATRGQSFALDRIASGALAGLAVILIAAPAQAQLAYTTLDFGTSGTILTGIRGDTITGHYLIPGTGEPGGLLYNLSTGTWTAFPATTTSGTNFPGAISSSPYGPSFGSQYGILNAVGTYQTQSSSPYNLSYLYNGAALPGEQLTTLAYPSKPGATTLNTNAHSTFGDQVVGSYDTEQQRSHAFNAFIYNINTGTYRTNDFPGAVSTTAYGVWGNLIAGGYAAPGPNGYVHDGYIYNESTGAWTSYSYPGAVDTHFEGISGGGLAGSYNLVARWVGTNGQSHGAVLHIGAAGNQTWINLGFPGASVTTGNSVYAADVIGVYNDTGRRANYQGYMVSIPGIYNPIQTSSSLSITSPNIPAITAANGDDVVNNGIIQTTGANSAGIQSGAVGVITNNGSINVTGAGSVGVQMNGAYGALLNSGSITASPGAYAIQTGPTALGTVVVNDGTIDGQVAVTAANARFENSGWLGISAPGAGITQVINGTFVQTSAGTLVMRIAPNSNDVLQVTGPAFLSGTLQAAFAPGSYVVKQYDIVHAAGVSGTFATLSTTNLPANFSANLSYSATDAFLNLTAALGESPSAQPSGGLNVNQQNVATALNNFFNDGAMPANFVNVFGLTGSSLGSGLMQLDGEVAADSEFAAFQMTTEFLNLMLDPFVDGRLGSGEVSAV